MTDWREAGYKADATTVAKLARGNFQSKAKNAIRRWVVAEIAAAAPELVLDLWGGGESADAMVDAGLRVVSVDDGRYLADLGVKRPRGKRALRICAESKGYEWDWGPQAIARNAPRCQAAFLDFMGQFCPMVARALEACRDMDVVVVTLMGEHSAIVRQGGPDVWQAMNIAAIRLYLPHVGRVLVRRYQRPNNHWAFVYVFGHVAGSSSHAVRQAALRADDGYRTVVNARERERRRARYASDQEYRDRLRAAVSEYQRNRRVNDPEWRARRNEWFKTYQREWRARRKAEREAAS